MQSADNGVTERRRGLHELADQIRCMREEFGQEREHLHNRLSVVEHWRDKTEPVVQVVLRVSWMIAGASLLFVTATGIVVWVWLKDHDMLQEVAKLSISMSTLITELQKTDNRLDRQVEELRQKHMRGN